MQVYLDSGAPPKNGFIEPEVTYVDPPEHDLQVLLGLVEAGDAVEGDGNLHLQPGDGQGDVGAGPASAASPAGAAAEAEEQTPKEIEVPFKRKDPPKPEPRNFVLSCKVWSPFFAKWIKQDAVVYCLEAKEACQASGQWTEDAKVPELFGAFELWDENSISDARNRHNNIMERVKAHADSIKDKVVNYFRWEGQGLALVADQHGFSKQLVDFYSRAPVWDYQDEEAIEKWNAIMKDAVAVSEQALVQGVGIGPPKQLEAPSAGEKGSKNAPANTGEVDGSEVAAANVVSQPDDQPAAESRDLEAPQYDENGRNADVETAQVGGVVTGGGGDVKVEAAGDGEGGGGPAESEAKPGTEGVVCVCLCVCVCLHVLCVLCAYVMWCASSR